MMDCNACEHCHGCPAVCLCEDQQDIHRCPNCGQLRKPQIYKVGSTQVIEQMPLWMHEDGSLQVRDPMGNWCEPEDYIVAPIDDCASSRLKAEQWFTPTGRGRIAAVRDQSHRVTMKIGDVVYIDDGLFQITGLELGGPFGAHGQMVGVAVKPILCVLPGRNLIGCEPIELPKEVVLKGIGIKDKGERVAVSLLPTDPDAQILRQQRPAIAASLGLGPITLQGIQGRRERHLTYDGPYSPDIASSGAEGILRALEHVPELMDAVLEKLEPRLLSGWRTSHHYRTSGPIYERVPVGEHQIFTAQVQKVSDAKWTWRLDVMRRAVDIQFTRQAGIHGEPTMDLACNRIDEHLRQLGYLLLGNREK